jgi:6-pyruvoyltetrahydropterin/6-carboxytetrahydropterin synthase
LEITVAGEPDPQTGMVIKLTDLKAVAEREIMTRFDHKDLNDDCDYFHRIPPTPEHFAKLIFRLLDAALPAGLLDRIRLHQTPDLYVDVIGPEP